MACQARWRLRQPVGLRRGRMHWRACPAWSRCRRWAGDCRRGLLAAGAQAQPHRLRALRRSVESGVGRSPAPTSPEIWTRPGNTRTPAGRPETSARLLPRPRPRQPPAAACLQPAEALVHRPVGQHGVEAQGHPSRAVRGHGPDLLGRGLRTERKCSPPGRAGLRPSRGPAHGSRRVGAVSSTRGRAGRPVRAATAGPGAAPAAGTR